MKTTLLGLLLAATTLGATTAHADWDHRWGRRPGGHYEPRTAQVWVPGVERQVWEPGRCWRSWGGPPRCAPGHSRIVATPGHYEARTDWVWIPHHVGPRFGLEVGPGRAAVAFGAPE